ncbi:MAG: hypothetical protein LBE13_20840 [Bacteroidales bacterium]|jgi:hypothetical protein|nr:hypothetical protein [Bacteroidales bacterium]
MNKKELYKYVESHIRAKLDFLCDYEIFVDYNRINRYSNYGDLQINYENKSINRFLEVWYMHKNGKGEISDTFDFWIDKGDGHSGFFVKNYMLFIQKKEIKYLCLNSFEGIFEEKLDKLLDYVVNILQTYLIPVLKGEEWVDVPTNWYGTR